MPNAQASPGTRTQQKYNIVRIVFHHGSTSLVPCNSHTSSGLEGTMGRPRCQRCGARPRRRIMCAWGCRRLLGSGCKKKCLLAEFMKGCGACTDCLPAWPLDSKGAGRLHPTPCVPLASHLQVCAYTCLQHCVSAMVHTYQ